MPTIRTALAMSVVLPSLAFATAAVATPIAPSMMAGLTEPAFSAARVTLGRKAVLPKKKRLHQERNRR